MSSPALTITTQRASPRLVLFVMCAGYFLVLLDVTIVNVALPRLGSALGAGVSALQWVVDGYAIALASLMLGAGTVGDLAGHKRMVLCGLALFGFASLSCALAPGFDVLGAFRVLEGVGAALLLPGALAVITHAYPEPDAGQGDRDLGRHRQCGAARWAAAGRRARGGLWLARDLLRQRPDRRRRRRRRLRPSRAPRPRDHRGAGSPPRRRRRSCSARRCSPR